MSGGTIFEKKEITAIDQVADAVSHAASEQKFQTLNGCSE